MRLNAQFNCESFESDHSSESFDTAILNDSFINHEFHSPSECTPLTLLLQLTLIPTSLVFWQD